MFNPKNINEAKGWVTGDCNGLDTERRWKAETPVLIQILANRVDLLSKGDEPFRVLDYGCGPGRLAKGLLKERERVQVVCVDNSADMRKIARQELEPGPRCSPRSPTLRSTIRRGGGSA